MTEDTTSTESHESEPTNPDHTDTGPDPGVVAALDAVATPLASTGRDEPLDDLAAFGDAVADARIVALGEATHGTREFSQIKARLLRYCVTELGTRTIGFEANVAESLAIDEYVVHGEGNPSEALEGIYLWTCNTEAVLGLLEWLREFNAGRPLNDRVRFHGFDAQYTGGSVDRLLTYFDRVDPDFVERIRGDLETIADGGTGPTRDDHVAERLTAGDRALPRIRERLDDRRDAYVETSGERAWAFADRHLRTIERALEYRDAMADPDEEDLVGSNAGVTEELLRIRETAMADGIDWLLDRTGNGPLVCWAHDAHVAVADDRAGDARTRSMGGRLADRHGDDYRALGFTFGRGAVRSIGIVSADECDGTERELGTWPFDGPLPGTVDATVDATGHDLALLDLQTASEDDRLGDWLRTERPHHSVGATYDPDAPGEYTDPYTTGEAFDLLIHVSATTPSRGL
jgi:erythromycin esterase